MQRGLNVIVYANGPCVPTGFGTVVREIFEGIAARNRVPIADLNFFGINYVGDPHPLPFKVWPAQVANSRDPDLFGRARFAQMLLNNAWPCDVLFLLEDTFTLCGPIPTANGLQPFIPFLLQTMREQVTAGRPPFKVVQYIPVDGMFLRPEWITYLADLVDHPVAYTEFGRRVMADIDPRLSRMEVIPHGTSPTNFFPVAPGVREQFRREQLKLDDDAKLIVNVNRNQPRKDIPKTLQAFKLIYEQDRRARLYLHMNVVDSAGYDLRTVIHQLRLPTHTVIFPGGFSEGVGLPLEALNLVYNAADVYLTTARGEGWGLPLTEAMTVGVPCVAPRHSSYTEILADGRGVLVDPEPTQDVIPCDNDQFRPVADVPKMAEAILRLLAQPAKAKRIGEKGRAWALANTWREHVVPRWEQILLRCLEELTQPASFASPQPLPLQSNFALNGLRLTA